MRREKTPGAGEQARWRQNLADFILRQYLKAWENLYLPLRLGVLIIDKVQNKFTFFYYHGNAKGNTL